MRFRKSKIFKSICFSLIFSFLTSSLTQAASLNLTPYNQLIPLSSAYSFPVLKGLKFDPQNPLKMEFIVDTGDKKDISQEEAALLIKYFLAGLTTPQKDIWVNLSPYEQDRIIPETLSQTDLGKDLLSQDYLLKQLTASLTYPESDTGKDYWSKTYTEVMKIAKTTKLPVNTFNKVWITPDEAEVYETDNAGLITKAKLKVMLEEDYLALKNKQEAPDFQKESQKYKMNQNLVADVNQAASKVMKEIILPKINQEVNSGQNFAQLRQIYYSLILGLWFKQKFQDTIYQHYINQGKTKGIDLEDKTVKEKVYQHYVQAFKTGLYNYIRTDQEPATHKKIKRRYYSGGFDLPEDFAVVIKAGDGAFSGSPYSEPIKNGKRLEVKFEDSSQGAEDGFPLSKAAAGANSPLEIDQSILNWSIGGKKLEKILKDVVKEYDIRGFDGKGDPEKYPQQFDEPLLQWMGRALGTTEFRSERHKRTVGLKPGDTFLVGGDNGPTTEFFRKNLIQGLRETGVNVIDLGLLPSGALYSSIARLGAQGGLYVTRSHVEVGTNGFKTVIGGITLYGSMLEALKVQILSAQYRKSLSFGTLDNSEAIRSKVRKMYLDKLKNEFSPLKEILDKYPVKIAVNLGGGSATAEGYEEIFAQILGSHLVKVFRDESDPFNEQGGLADPSREDEVALSHPKLNIKKYSEENPDVLVINFDLDADRVSIVWGGKLYLGDELFYPVIEYMLTLDKYKELNKTIPFYYDPRMKPEVSQLIEGLGGRAQIHPKGHSKIKTTVDLSLEENARDKGHSSVKAFLGAHPGFVNAQAEYSLHMFLTDENGTPIDDAIRFSFFWLKVFSAIKENHSNSSWKLSDYIQDLKDRKIIKESVSLKEQRTDMPNEAKKQVMKVMKDEVIEFFKGKDNLEFIDNWQEPNKEKKPFTLVDIDGVFDLRTPIGNIYWGWSNTSPKVTFGAHAANSEDRKALTEILVAWYVHTRNQISQQLNMSLPVINDQETVDLRKLFEGRAAAEIERMALTKYPQSEGALKALASIASSAISLKLIPPGNLALANRVSDKKVFEFTKSKVFESEERLVKVGMEWDLEAFGQALLYGDGASRHGKPMEETLEKLDEFYQRHFAGGTQDFKGDVEIAGIGIGGQMDVTDAIVGTIRHYNNRNSSLLASLGKDYNAIEERWIRFLREGNNPRLFWIVGSKSGTTPETMINFQETAKTMIRVWARKLSGDEKGKVMADKLINKLYDGKPLYEKKLAALNLSDEERGVLRKVFSTLIVVTGSEESGSLLAKLVNKSFINELYPQDEEKVVVIDLPANLGGRKQSIGPNAAAYAGGLRVDSLKMQKASRELAQEIMEYQEKGLMHPSKELAIKLFLSQAKQFIIVHPNDIIFKNITGALEQILPESLGKGRGMGLPVGMQTYSFNKDDINNSAFVKDIKGEGRVYFVIDVMGQEPIKLAEEIQKNNWVIKYTLQEVSEGELSKLFQFVEEVTMRYGFFNLAQALLRALEDKISPVHREEVTLEGIDLRRVIRGPQVNEPQDKLYEELHETYKNFSPDRQPNVEKAKKITKDEAKRLFNLNPEQPVFDENGLPIRDETKRGDFYTEKNSALTNGVILDKSSLGLTNGEGKYVTDNAAKEVLDKQMAALKITPRQGDLDKDGIRKLLDNLEKLQGEMSRTGVPRNSFVDIDKLVKQERELFAKIKDLASGGSLTEALEETAKQLAALVIKAHYEGKSLDFVLYEDRTPLLEAFTRFKRYLGIDKSNHGTIVLIKSVKTLDNLKKEQRPIIYDGLVGKEIAGLYPSEVNALNLEAYIKEFKKVKTGVAALMTKDVTEQENLIELILLFTRTMEIVHQTTSSSATAPRSQEETAKALKEAGNRVTTTARGTEVYRISSVEGLPEEVKEYWDDHEALYVLENPKIGYRAYVGIHAYFADKKEGKPPAAIGGTRVKEYGSEIEAIIDVLRLSRAMSSKNALAGLNKGGAKVVINMDPQSEKKRGVLKDLALTLGELKIMITSTDSGTTPEDIAYMAEFAPDVVAGAGPKGPNIGLGGELTSPATALGVFKGIIAAVQFAFEKEIAAGFESSELKGKRISLQGLGGVGSILLEKLLKAGAIVVATDTEPSIRDKIKEKHSEFLKNRQLVILENPDDIYKQEVDIFCPCALGGILNEKNITLLKEAGVKIIAGAANNQLEKPEEDSLSLYNAGIIYVIDYVINAAGVMAAVVKIEGFGLTDKIEGIGKTVKDILKEAFKQNVPPAVVADTMADKIISAKRKKWATTSSALSPKQEKAVSMIKEKLRLAGGDDYFIKPFKVEENTEIEDGDSVIFFNFRGDRMQAPFRLLTGDPEFRHFSIKDKHLVVAPFAVYDNDYFKKYGFEGIVEELPVEETLGDVIAKNNKTQVRIAESEKFGHVTRYFDGLRQVELPGMDTVQIPSNKIDKHWKKPEMKAVEIAQEAKRWILGEDGKAKKDFIVVNFANGDILGHFDEFDAIVKGVSAVDEALGIIRAAVKQAGGITVITADHGSAEQKVRLNESGQPILGDDGNIRRVKAHSFDNKVPFIIEGAGDVKLGKDGSLKNIAPTILELMGIKKPEAMTAESLLREYVSKPVNGPVVLVIRDGWGISKFNNPEALKYNAIHQAELRAQAEGREWNDGELMKQAAHTELWAHGKYIGHPEYQMGDSENGHLNISAGRDVETPLGKLNKMFESGELANNKLIRKAIDNAKKGHKLHLVGMLSTGGVHSHREHASELVEIIAKEKDGISKIVLHPIFDGRDVESSDEPGWESLEKVLLKGNELGLQAQLKVGVTSGRYYPMDRDAINRDKKGQPSAEIWIERLKPWYDEITNSSSSIRYSFKTQLERLDKFMLANRGKGSIRGRIEEAFASDNVFLSKTSTLPTSGIGLTTRGSTGIHDEAQGGTSAGTKEPITLSKKDAYQDKELEIFNKYIKPRLLDKNVANALKLDEILEEIGRSLKPNPESPDLIYAGPVITATSMVIVRSLARSANVDEEVVLFSLYNQLAKEYDAPKLEEMTLPIYMAKSNDGGMHGATKVSNLLPGGKIPVLPIQEFLFIPAGYNTYEEALRALREVTAKFHKLVKEIDPDFKYGAEAAIKSEKLSSNRQVLELMTQAIQETQAAGMFIGIDTAASELYKSDKGYYFGDDAKQLYLSKDGFINTEQVIDYYEKLVKDFPRLISIEDGFSEHDVEGWKKGTERLGYRLNLVADDVTVTAPEIVEKGAEEKWANALLNKINQAGTMRRSLLASIIVRTLPVKKHKLLPWLIAVFHRSGEPANQDMMAILAIAIAAEFIKTTVGSIEGGGQGREAKVNALSMISEKWRNRGAPLPYAGARMLNNPQRGFEKIVKKFTENKIFGKDGKIAASSAIDNPNRIAELKMGNTDGGTLEELYKSPSDDVGGIDLEDIAERTRVKAGPSTSSSLPKIDGSPAHPFIPADFPQWPGLFFKIVRIEDIEDLEKMFTAPLYAKAESP